MNRYVVFLVLLLVACNSNESCHTLVPEIAATHIFSCIPNENTSSLSAKIYGQVDDSVSVSFHSSNDLSVHIYKLNFKKGTIDTTFSIDWYSETLTAKYHPNNCTEGNLTINTSFH